MQEILFRVAPFRSVPLVGLRRLADSGVTRSFLAGDVLIQQGTVTRSMYVVLSGSVRIERTHPDMTDAVVMALCGPGETAGEQGLLDDGPRLYSVVAAEAAMVLELDGRNVIDLMQQYPHQCVELLRLCSSRPRNIEALSPGIPGPVGP